MDYRIKIIEIIRVFSVVEFILGFLLLFFAFYGIYTHDGPAQSGTAPYVIGGHIAGFSIILLSLVSGAVYYKGRHVRTAALETLVIQGAKPSIRIFLFSAPISFVFIIIGLALTISYGVCSVQCSYSDNDQAGFNQGMAILLVVLELLSMLVLVANTVIVLKSCSQFNISLTSMLGHICGRFLDGGPDDSTYDETEQDVYNLQKWRVGIEHELNFPKVRQYYQESREPVTEQVDPPDGKKTSEQTPSEISSINSK